MSAGFRRFSRLALFAGSALASFPVFAQEAQSAADDNDPNVIIVTAQKRSENLQNVPISIQALGSQNLEQHQVASFDDYAKMLPSVSFQSFGPGQAQLSFRGITSGGDGLHGGSLPTASLYLDEVPVTTIAGAVDLHIYDVSRVEALSGPQGTLFGASSLAGTLRIITNKPDTKETSGRIDFEGTKFGKGGYGGTVEGYFNLPLNERMALRVSAFYERDGGYIDNVPGTRTYTLADNDPSTNLTINNARYVKKDFNTVDTYGGRAALKVDLDDNWTVTPQVVYQKQRAHGSFLFDPRLGDLKVTDYATDLNRDEWVQAALTIQGKLSDWDVTYAGGYFDRRVDNQADYSEYTVAYDSLQGSFYTNFPTASGGYLDPTQAYHGHDSYTKQTHELRVASPSTDRLRLVAGLFFQRQTDRIVADYVIPGLAGIPNSPAVPKAGDDIFATRAYRVDRDYAAFIDGSYDITPNLTLSGGIRAFIANNTFVGFSGFASAVTQPNCIAVSASDRVCNNFNKKAVQSGETHRANLTWRIDPERLVYVTYSTGYRPGGNNRRPGINPYQPDTLDNYEFGFKTTWFDRKLRLNGAVFYEKWKKLQYGLSPVGSAGVTNIYNAGDARVYGVEADAGLKLGNLMLSASGTYIDAKLTTNFCSIGANGNVDCTLGVVAAAKGTRLPIQPRFKGNATARYSFNIGPSSAFVQASMLHQSGTRSYLTDAEANLLGSTKGFETFDFSIGGTFSGIDIEAFVENAFDKRGVLSINTVCAPTICGAGRRYYPIKPQMFGLKFGRSF
ncbi:TonB-dependent receptor [Novosphingobium sp. EMRT-2]|uniref:TonB-dependent receptor n=1 Tax=Novosphingobium sp. EMRT-2 TaxID=2571749 RepID=UPI0010BD5BD4|nr:TonB-dependent receptor [Novosphingobium sp. EMRT-2]QCI94494.1 TonB-dependent receptor [Novosphingobium sp. EMRT-2]